MAGAKGKSGRRNKFEKVDLATLDARPGPKGAWANTPTQPPPNNARLMGAWASGPPNIQNSSQSSPPGQADVPMQLDDAWETSEPLFGQRPVRYVHLPYQTIATTVDPWLEGEHYGPEWQADKWCEVNNDWSNPEVRNPTLKRDTHTDMWGARFHNLSFRGKQYKDEDPKPGPRADGKLLAEKWDPTKLYEKSEDPAPALSLEPTRASNGQEKSHRKRNKNKKSDGLTVREFKTVTKGNTQSHKPKMGLHDFPDEILERILTFALRHHEPLDVDIHWQPLPYDKASPLDARVLHASNRLYGIGIGIYYTENTWRVDITEAVNNMAFFRQLDTPPLALKRFQTPPKYPEKEQWTTIHALHIGRECVQRVILKNKYSIWDAAVPFLYGFDNLKEVGFDLRPRYDKAPGWQTIPLSAECHEVIKRAGVNVSTDNMWVGHTSCGEAEEKMRSWFTSTLVAGAQPYITGVWPEPTTPYDSDDEI